MYRRRSKTKTQHDSNGRWTNNAMTKRDKNTIAKHKRKQARNDNNSARLNCNDVSLALWPIIFAIYMLYTLHAIEVW